MIESIIQSIRHITGLCGESHPSILLSSIGLMSCLIHYIRRLKRKITLAISNSSLYAPHGSEMEEARYREEENFEKLGPRDFPFPYLPGRYVEKSK